MDRTAEKKWIVLCQKGDRDAFGPIVEAYKRKAYFTALGILGDPEDAHDVSQEAFIRAFRALRRFDLERDFAPWFFRILRNLCSSVLAKRKKRPSRSLDELRERGREPVADDRFRPDMLAERTEAAERIWRGLAALDRKSREVIVLKDLQDYRYREIAEILEIPIGTVMSRLYHARQKLKDQLVGEEESLAV